MTIYPLTVMFSFTAMTKTESECSIWNEQIEEKDTCSFKETYTNLSFDVNLKLVSDKQLQAIDILHISLMYALTFDIGNLTSWKEYKLVINEENPTDVSLYTLTIKIYKTMFEEEGNNFIQMVNDLKWQLKLYDEITGDTFTVDKHSGNSSNTQKKSVLNYDKLFLEANYTYPVNDMCPILKSFHEIPKRDSLCPDIAITAMRKNISHLAITSFVCQLKIEKPPNRLKAVVTYTCMSVSIFSLILLIIIYRKLNLSSSIPGSNLENVAVSLIFSNLLFMLGIGASDNGLVCYVIGVSLHYIWLAVFSFMSVSVCCITLTLIKIRSNGLDRKDNLTQKRRCLTFVGMIIPLFFVCPAVLLDLYGSSYLSSGYSTQPCFPNKYPANVIFFSGPSLLSIIINFICLLRIVINICKLQSEIRHVSKTNPYRYAKVYLRILVISGFFWLIGFVSSVFKNEWLEYSFIIICGLHGLFVSLASLSTRRIVRSFVEVRESKTSMVS
ncbi:unnamed protein product [Mytilus edulis]|uniref:G-protein coupled receptors family 2 profile 2 domain-containing protein n=1 Tax=Mytilus edulis TaxID=6550 RepID=A0A8S3TTL3_MYTED|nr:unnamed protein product [Mytilus edulis]